MTRHSPSSGTTPAKPSALAARVKALLDTPQTELLPCELELQSPQDSRAEDTLMEALSHPPAFLESSKEPWYLRWRWLWTSHTLAWGGIGAFLLVFATWKSGLFAPSTEVLRVKGNAAPPQEHSIVLHVGRWEPSTQTLRRLGANSTLTQRESIIFGVSPIPPGGYVYLWRINPKGEGLLLYPFTADQPSQFPSKPQLALLKHRGVVQQYQLRQEQGTIRFVVIQVPTPLSRKQHQWLQQHPELLHRPIALWRALNISSKESSFTIFPLKVRRGKR